MLAGLARWLRAAGHDALLVGRDQTKDQLIGLCEREDRVLLSRDRRFVRRIERRVRALLLTSEDVETQVLAVARRLGVDWTFAPFTRCLIDNAELRPATDEEMLRMPAPTRSLPGPFRACPSCSRVYWPGSHVRRMEEKLKRWREASRENDDSDEGAGRLD
jgi:uncharacterized protein with PIN domain